jgi:hypothetical protein
MKGPNDIITCEFCGNEYTRSNKSRHKKSMICKAYQDGVRIYNDFLLTDSKKIKSFDDLIKKPYTDKKGNTIFLNNLQLKFINKLH